MPSSIVNTSPLLYLYRIDAIEWLPQLFDQVWSTSAVVAELREGLRRGYDAPEISNYAWLKIVEPRNIPSEWLALDLGKGEISAMALALENQSYTLLLDDMRAREIAHAAGLTIWGTLRVLLEAKKQGLIPKAEPLIDRLSASGMYISKGIRMRILKLAGEASE
jgi:predicted nucleic acid-binding protein